MTKLEEFAQPVQTPKEILYYEMINDTLGKYELNHLTVELRMAEFELANIKEINPTDYVNIIKDKMTQSLSKQMVDRIAFTKRVDVDDGSHRFMGRVWVFTEHEFKEMLLDLTAKNILDKTPQAKHATVVNTMGTMDTTAAPRSA